jgi:surfactin synthase thioesterase subunit
MLLFARAWDFDIAAVSAPTKVWLGLQDRNVPRAAALRLAERIKGGDAERIDGAGHFWVTANFEEVLVWVARTADDNARHGPRVRTEPPAADDQDVAARAPNRA